MNKFIVSSSPFMHSNNDVNKMFLYTALSLVVPAVFGVTFFGVSSILIIILSLVTCFLSESLYNLIHKKKFMVDNFSFFVTAMVLALTMPVGTPYIVVVVSAFFSIFIVKMTFGGLGRNYFNPGLAGRCFAGMICPAIASELCKVTIAGEEYVSLASGGTNTIYNLILGQGVGGIGTTCVLIIVVCLVFLTYTRIVDAKIPLISILSYFVVGLLLCGLNQTVLNLFSGSFLFISVFMLTDPNTSPDTTIGKIIYSCAFGALSAVVWNMGILGENSLFAVALFVNLLVPYIDRVMIWRPINLGGYRNAYKN